MTRIIYKVQCDSGLAACSHCDLIYAETFIILQCSQNRTVGFTRCNSKIQGQSQIGYRQSLSLRTKYSVIKEKLSRFFFSRQCQTWRRSHPTAFSIYTCISLFFVFQWFGLVYKPCDTWKKDNISDSTSTSRKNKIGDLFLTIN